MVPCYSSLESAIWPLYIEVNKIFDSRPPLSGVGKCPPKFFFYFLKFFKIFFMERGDQGDTETDILKFLSHTINVLGAVKSGKSGGEQNFRIFGICES